MRPVTIVASLWVGAQRSRLDLDSAVGLAPVLSRGMPGIVARARAKVEVRPCVCYMQDLTLDDARLVDVDHELVRRASRGVVDTDHADLSARSAAESDAELRERVVGCPVESDRRDGVLRGRTQTADAIEADTR